MRPQGSPKSPTGPHHPASSYRILIWLPSQQITQPGLLFSCLKGSCSLLVRKRQASTAAATSHPIPFCYPVPGIGGSLGHFRVGARSWLKETKDQRKGSDWICLAQDLLSSLR